MPQNIQVAHRVQNLVLDKLVVGTKTTYIEHAIFVHHDGVFKRAALSKPHGAKQFHFGDKAEGACATHRLLVRFEPQIHHGMLYGRINRRMTESDCKIENHAVVRF